VGWPTTSLAPRRARDRQAGSASQATGVRDAVGPTRTLPKGRVFSPRSSRSRSGPGPRHPHRYRDEWHQPARADAEFSRSSLHRAFRTARVYQPPLLLLAECTVVDPVRERLGQMGEVARRNGRCVVKIIWMSVQVLCNTAIVRSTSCCASSRWRSASETTGLRLSPYVDSASALHVDCGEAKSVAASRNAIARHWLRRSLLAEAHCIKV
jgi:hypothetical protein